PFPPFPPDAPLPVCPSPPPPDPPKSAIVNPATSPPAFPATPPFAPIELPENAWPPPLPERSSCIDPPPPSALADVLLLPVPVSPSPCVPFVGLICPAPPLNPTAPTA